MSLCRISVKASAGGSQPDELPQASSRFLASTQNTEWLYGLSLSWGSLRGRKLWRFTIPLNLTTLTFPFEVASTVEVVSIS
jgi:hypothetical protein